MKGRILVAYATRYGSTREIAEAIATTLRAAGLAVDCRDMREVRAVDDYRGFVLGAPFYFGRWPRTARRFLNRFGPVLAHRDVAVFGTGQLDATRPPTPEVHAQMDSLGTHYDWLHPFATGVFGGSYNPQRLTGVHRLLLHLPGSPLRGQSVIDLRDWTEISAWACDIAAILKSHVAQPITPAAEPPTSSRADAPLSIIREYVKDQQLAPEQRKDH